MARKKKVEVKPVVEVTAPVVETAAADPAAAPVAAAPAVEAPVPATPPVPVGIPFMAQIDFAISSVLVRQMGNNTAMHNLRNKLLNAIKSIR